jgi:hypothetical protein
MANRQTLALPSRTPTSSAAPRKGSPLRSYDAIAANVATKADVTQLRSDIKTDITALYHKVDLISHRLMTRLGGLIAVATGILIAIKYFG